VPQGTDAPSKLLRRETTTDSDRKIASNGNTKGTDKVALSAISNCSLFARLSGHSLFVATANKLHSNHRINQDPFHFIVIVRIKQSFFGRNKSGHSFPLFTENAFVRDFKCRANSKCYRSFKEQKS
jgi:hypothetical protein